MIIIVYSNKSLQLATFFSDIFRSIVDQLMKREENCIVSGSFSSSRDSPRHSLLDIKEIHKM